MVINLKVGHFRLRQMSL